MKKAEVKMLVTKIITVVIDALFKSCSKKNKQPPDTDLDASRHPEQQGTSDAS